MQNLIIDNIDLNKNPLKTTYFKPIDNKIAKIHVDKAKIKFNNSKNIRKNQFHTVDPYKVLLSENERKWVQRKILDDQMENNNKNNYNKNNYAEKIGYLPNICENNAN